MTAVTDYYADLGERLRAIRKMQGLSQAEAAARMGFRQDQLSKVELGHRRLGVHEVQAVATALDVGTDVVLGTSAVLITHTTGSFS